MSKLSPFECDITPAAALTEILEAASLFNASAVHSDISPVDRFIENSNKLSVLYTGTLRQSFTPELGAVLLLGHVSAVESYMRGIIRGLVHIDERSENLVATKQLSYFAASHSVKSLLPEALLEGASFSSAANVAFTLKEFCGITGMGNGDVPKELKPVFGKFADICQVRHCCVHRFGLLGAGNAHKLRIPKDSPLIEKPLELSIDVLEDISSILQKFVLSLNSYLHRDVLQRSFMKSALGTIDESEWHYEQLWVMDYSQDQSRFDSYHKLFAITAINPPSMSATDAYHLFQQWMKQTHTEIQKARAGKAGQGNNSSSSGPTSAQQPSSSTTTSQVYSVQPTQHACSTPISPPHQSVTSKVWQYLCSYFSRNYFKT